MECLTGVLAPLLKGGEDFDRNLAYAVTRVPGYRWGTARVIPGFLSSSTFRKTVLRQTDRLLAISRFTKDRLIDFGVSPERVRVCYLGVDLEMFFPESHAGAARKELGIGSEGPILLTVGRLVSRKKHRFVLETIRDLKRDWPGLSYWIVGRGPEERALREFAGREGLQQNVRFWGKVHDNELPLFYQACDLFLLPAVQEGPSVEGLGLVLQEAAACGKPTIAASSGGIPEAMVPGRTGILVPPGNRDELGRAIQGLLADSEKMNAMGKAGRDWAIKEKDWRVCARKIVDALADS
jgi:phosphatidylinositol alpha-1,6-mannosyltransferase